MMNIETRKVFDFVVKYGNQSEFVTAGTIVARFNNGQMHHWEVKEALEDLANRISRRYLTHKEV